MSWAPIESGLWRWHFQIVAQQACLKNRGNQFAPVSVGADFGSTDGTVRDRDYVADVIHLGCCNV